MKKFTKICLEIIGICFIVGAILFMVGCSLGGYHTFQKMLIHNEFTIPYIWDSSTLRSKNEGSANHTDDNSLSSTENATSTPDGSSNTGNASTDTQTFQANDIKKLNINLTYGELKFVTSDSTNSICVAATHADSSYSVTQDEQTLTIVDSQKYDKHRLNWNLWEDDHLIVVVTVPNNMNFEQSDISINAGLMKADSLSSDVLNLNVDAGQFEIQKLLVSSNATLTIGAGKMDVESGSIANLDLKCGTGQAQLNTTLTGKNNLNCSVGEIDLKTNGSQEDFNYDIACDIGQVDIGTDSYSGFSNEKQIDHGSDKSLHITCNIGHVNVTFE